MLAVHLPDGGLLGGVVAPQDVGLAVAIEIAGAAIEIVRAGTAEESVVGGAADQAVRPSRPDGEHGTIGMDRARLAKGVAPNTTA